jgi:plastocyanin
MRSSRTTGFAILTGILVVCSACGGGSSYSGPTPTAPTPPAPGASTITIVADRGAQSFTPNPATVTQGQMVVWRNSDSVVHRIALNDGSLDTGNIAPGATSAQLRLPTDGANYHCTIHPTMIGAINASAGAPPPCTGPYC